MAAKMAKLPQTDWTRGGHDISQTAIPLYQTNLTRMGNYLEDPMAYQQKYIDKYFGADAVQNQDLLRQYNRAMGNATGNNYAATAGGLTSSAQRAYNDQQRYYNDMVARLQGENVANAYNMSNQDYQNMIAANNSFNDAYQLGKNYSAIETQNYLADEYNKNKWANALSAFGAANMEASNYVQGPWKAIPMAIGGTAMGAGAIFTKDFSGANSAWDAIYGGGKGTTSPLGGNNQNNTFTNWYKGISSMFNPQSASGGSGGGVIDTLSSKVGYQQPQGYSAATMAGNSGFGNLGSLSNLWSFGK